MRKSFERGRGVDLLQQKFMPHRREENETLLMYSLFCFCAPHPPTKKILVAASLFSPKGLFSKQNRTPVWLFTHSEKEPRRFLRRARMRCPVGKTTFARQRQMLPRGWGAGSLLKQQCTHFGQIVRPRFAEAKICGAAYFSADRPYSCPM